MGSEMCIRDRQCTEGLSSVNIRKLLLLRGSVPKNGPIDFASKNHFYLNSAEGKGLVPKY